MLVYFNVLRLWYTDLWGHVAYGRWMLDHGALPTLEPFMPLAASVRVINYCWLSQLIFALVERWGGAAALSNLFALTVTARYIVMARTCYLQTRRLGLAMGGMLGGFLLSWVRNPIMRPEIFAALCFQLLLWVLAAHDSGAWQRSDHTNESPERPWGWGMWTAVPLLFAAWVNLHASFLVGLVVLGAHLAGRVIEVCIEARRFDASALLADRSARRWVALCALAGLAVLINPRGPGVVADAMAISRNPNLRTVSEWLPLGPSSLFGRLFALSWGVLVVIFRLSRRRVRPVEALLLGLFVTGTFLSGRFLMWYVPVYLYAVLPHIAEIAGRWLPARPAPAMDGPGALPPGRSFRYTVVALFVLWATFASSHLSDALLGAEPRKPESLYHHGTPRGIADYLIAHPPAGQVWNSQALGDWITWAWLSHHGPDQPLIKLFTNTHMHLIPTQVWNDYQAIGTMRPGWKGLLERYEADTMVISKIQHPLLAREARDLAGWTVQYEDEIGLVVTRNAAKP
jgi:hypothetical protein